MPTSTPIDRQRVLVLGAGPGLGTSVARRFGREGFSVTLVARSEEHLADLADGLRGTGISVDAVAAHAADPHGFRTALEGLAGFLAPERSRSTTPRSLPATTC
ncbi:SDR family NAD(P)-dependent oxidoreductase [Kocuria rosea]|jgi:short-subunit dehydrogenase|uniref:SDR family NAD(P)-dependent oxidoreductase n=1 Tax=Kocuria rosea TaxID=1275 RepID=UPI00204212A6|nr:SDR family NAD(P)-dependent oxidoreductase [Kocuria rosea]MCM3689143.1 SDR family NAD(P)-dependent oxidoreductase [Kocuria rosea]